MHETGGMLIFTQMAVGRVLRRRIFGAAVLGAAVLLLVLGQTILQPHLNGLGFLIYWLLCLVLTGVAVGVALRDARETRIQVKQERRELLEQTIKDIQEEAARKQRGKKR